MAMQAAHSLYSNEERFGGRYQSELPEIQIFAAPEAPLTAQAAEITNIQKRMGRSVPSAGGA